MDSELTVFLYHCFSILAETTSFSQQIFHVSVFDSEGAGVFLSYGTAILFIQQRNWGG